MSRLSLGVLGMLAGIDAMRPMVSLEPRDTPPMPDLHRRANKTGPGACDGCGRAISRNKDMCLKCATEAA